VRPIVVDLIPALLSWEGRDLSGEPDVAPEAGDALGRIYERYRLAGLVDAAAEITGRHLRDHLLTAGLADLFDMIGTTSEFGPVLTPRVLRKVIRTLGGPDDRTVLVTARQGLAQDFRGSRVPVVLTSQEEFGSVPEKVEALLGGGRVDP